MVRLGERCGFFSPEWYGFDPKSPGFWTRILHGVGGTAQNFRRVSCRKWAWWRVSASGASRGFSADGSGCVGLLQQFDAHSGPGLGHGIGIVWLILRMIRDVWWRKSVLIGRIVGGGFMDTVADLGDGAGFPIAVFAAGLAWCRGSVSGFDSLGGDDDRGQT